MTKVSPIASYLTQNKALTKREGNVWHFFNKQGLYLGRQIKIENNGATAYVREIYGEYFKKLFYECKAFIEHCVYIKDEFSPIGISILTVKSYKQTVSVDFLKNKIKSTQTEKELKNDKELIAIDRNTGTGIYDIQRPFIYDLKKTLDKTENLKQSLHIKHTIN